MELRLKYTIGKIGIGILFPGRWNGIVESCADVALLAHNSVIFWRDDLNEFRNAFTDMLRPNFDVVFACFSDPLSAWMSGGWRSCWSRQKVMNSYELRHKLSCVFVFENSKWPTMWSRRGWSFWVRCCWVVAQLLMEMCWCKSLHHCLPLTFIRLLSQQTFSD